MGITQSALEGAGQEIARRIVARHPEYAIFFDCPSVVSRLQNLAQAFPQNRAVTHELSWMQRPNPIVEADLFQHWDAILQLFRQLETQLAETQRQATLRAQQEAQRQAALRAQQEAQRQAALRAQQEAQRQAALQAQQAAQRQAALRAQQEAQRQAALQAQQEAQRQAALQAQQEAQRQTALQAQQEAQRLALVSEAAIARQTILDDSMTSFSALMNMETKQRTSQTFFESKQLSARSKATQSLFADMDELDSEPPNHQKKKVEKSTKDAEYISQIVLKR